MAEIEKTSDGGIYKVTFSNGVVSKVEYSSGGTNVEYSTDTNGKGTYTVKTSAFSGTKVDGKTAASTT